MKRLKIFCLFLFTILLSNFSLNAATATLLVGQTYQTEISATGYHYLSIESVSSTNPSVSVTKMGLVVKATVNAYFTGESDITIRLRYQLYAGQSYQYRNQSFTIACNDTQVNISPTNVSLKVGESYQLTYGFNRPTYVTPSLQWTSSDESIVTVSSTGLVVAKGIGNATIYLRTNLGSNTSECRVSVTDTGGGSSGDNPILGNGDRSWYNSLLNEFHISRGEELVGLMSMVAEGNTFSGKTIFLDNDIDLNSLNWTTPIGVNEQRPFSGIFDGQNNNINYRIEYTTNGATSQISVYFGLFGYINGSLKNLSTTGHISITAASNISRIFIGGLVGMAEGNRQSIAKCFNNVSIEYDCKSSYTSSVFLGGIVSYITSSYIASCINCGDIVDKTNVAGNSQNNNHFLGGICGYSKAIIENCYNSASIECVPRNSYNSQINSTAIVGGIVGTMFPYSQCRGSANTGNVLGSAKIVKLGGIGGVIPDDAVVVNCYVASSKLGDMFYKASSSSYIGLLGGNTSSSASYVHNFVASDILKYNIRNGLSADESYSISDMKTEAFVSVLNLYSYYVGGNGLFPIPKPTIIFMPQYFFTSVRNITCTSAVVKSNANQILGNDITTCGFLIRLDDGTELYKQCATGTFELKLNDLLPNRTYYIRWFAKDAENREYYGYETNFATKSITPNTCEPYVIGVSTAVLKGESYLEGNVKCGFFIQKEDNPASGEYLWGKHLNNSQEFYVRIDNLEGNSKYKYSAVIEYDGIIYEGEEKNFITKYLMTLIPSDFSNSTVQLNGEISEGLHDVHFEFRSIALPSVIESEIINAIVENNNVIATSPTLTDEESYRYRIVAHDGTEILYGDWVEFLFIGETSVKNIVVEDDFESQIITAYTLNGIQIFQGLYRDFEPESGIYIIIYKNKSYKVRY